MGKVSFFTMLLDDNMSWWERDAINSAHERADAALDAASMQGQAFSRSIVGMQKVIQQQATQIRMLNAAVQTLAAVLRDNNLVDPDVTDGGDGARCATAATRGVADYSTTALCA